MEKVKKIILVTREQWETLISGGTITHEGVEYTLETHDVVYLVKDWFQNVIENGPAFPTEDVKVDTYFILTEDIEGYEKGFYRYEEVSTGVFDWIMVANETLFVEAEDLATITEPKQKVYHQTTDTADRIKGLYWYNEETSEWERLGSADIPSGDTLPSGRYEGELFILLKNIVEAGGTVKAGLYRYNGSLWELKATTYKTVELEEESGTLSDGDYETLTVREDNVIVDADNNVYRYTTKTDDAYIYRSLNNIITINTDKTYEKTLEDLDYDFESIERLGDYLHKVTFDKIPEYDDTVLTSYGACSSFVKDGKLYRNYDWKYDEAPSFMVVTKNFEGMAYASGMTDGELNLHKVEQLPYHMVDGVNRNGIMVSTHVLYNDFSYEGSGDKDKDITLLPYYILENLTDISTIDTTLGDYLANLKIPASLTAAEYLLQFVVTDGTTSYVITPSSTGYEIVDITANPKLTNFKWAENEIVARTDLQTRPNGVERWNSINSITEMADLRFTKAYEEPTRLSEFIGEAGTTKDSTDAELEAIYDEAHAKYLDRHRDGELWQTMHSVVYGANGMEHLFVQENWDRDYIATAAGFDVKYIELDTATGILTNAQKEVLEDSDMNYVIYNIGNTSHILRKDRTEIEYYTDFGFVANADSTIGYIITGTVDVNIKASSDGVVWEDWDGSNKTLATGERLFVKNTTNTLAVDYSNYISFTTTGDVKVVGNIMGMLNNATELTNGQSFRWLFRDCSAITDISFLKLADNTSSYCYELLFNGCTGITSIPKDFLPSLTLSEYCYHSMFSGCTGLTSLPNNLLPASNLAISCYYQMFQGCTNLKLSESPTGEYRTEFRMPSSGVGVDAVNSMIQMFLGTGGSFADTPTINKTYYGAWDNPDESVSRLESDIVEKTDKTYFSDKYTFTYTDNRHYSIVEKPVVEVKYDDDTIDINSNGELRIKDEGIRDHKINPELKATEITETPVDRKFATEKAVKDYVDDLTSVDDITIDRNADNDLEVKDEAITNAKVNPELKATTIEDEITATDDKLATEKAVRTELNKKANKFNWYNMATRENLWTVAGGGTIDKLGGWLIGTCTWNTTSESPDGNISEYFTFQVIVGGVVAGVTVGGTIFASRPSSQKTYVSYKSIAGAWSDWTEVGGSSAVSDGQIGEFKNSVFLLDNFVAADGTTDYEKTGLHKDLFDVFTEKAPGMLIAGSDANHFKLLDLRDKFVKLGGVALQQGGEKTHKLTINEMPSHSHNIKYDLYSSAASGTRFIAFQDTTSTISGFLTNTGGDAAHNNEPQYITMIPQFRYKVN